MITIKGKYLAARELPARDPYPASYLITVLEGTETLTLVASGQVGQQLSQTPEYTDVELEVARGKSYNLKSLGVPEGGTAHKLRIVGVAGGRSK